MNDQEGYRIIVQPPIDEDSVGVISAYHVDPENGMVQWEMEIHTRDEIYRGDAKWVDLNELIDYCVCDLKLYHFHICAVGVKGTAYETLPGVHDDV